MSNAIVVRPGFFARTWGVIGRAFGLTSAVPPADNPPPDAAFAGAPWVDNAYSPEHALSAMRANAWVLACVEAIYKDLTRCPIRSYSLRDPATDANGRRIRPMPVPNRILEGAQWRRDRAQGIVDRVMTGRAAFLILRRGDPVTGEPIALRRLHPENLKPVPDQFGDLLAWQYNASGTIREYRPQQIMILQTVGWAVGPDGMNPQSVIQTLEADIEADAAIAKHARISAAKGRPDVIISPTSDKAWGTPQIERLKAVWNEVFSSDRAGGAAINGENVKLDVLGWAPKDMEGRSQREWTRQSIMAVFQVPPARLSLDSLNRATQDDQMVTYWTGNIQSLASEFDNALNDALGQQLGLRFETDFSDIPYLQAAKTAQIDRVKRHVELGMSVVSAYAYEGLDDVDSAWFTEPAAPQGKPADAKSDTDSDDEQASIEDVRNMLADLRAALDEAGNTDALSLLDDVDEIVAGLA